MADERYAPANHADRWAHSFPALSGITPTCWLFFLISADLAGLPPIPVAEPLPNAFALVTADLNGDSRGDVLIGTANGIVRLMGAPDAGMLPGVPILSGCRVAALAVLDADADRVTDVAALCPDSNALYLLKGTGKGEFMVMRLSAQTGGGYGLVAVDLNGDGLTDLAVAHYGGLLLLQSKGDGTFREARVRGTGTVISIAAGDFNGDGWPDLAASKQTSPFVALYYASGGGEFRDEKVLAQPCSGYARVLKAADLDGDGYADLAAACDSGVGVWKGSVDGPANFSVAISDQNLPLSLDFGDVNNDGAKDIVIGDYYGGRIAIHLGKGAGTFAVPVVLRAAGDVFAVSFADVDGDSHQDVVATSYSSDSGLVALGRGDGRFEDAILLGSLPSLSFFRKAPPGRDGRTAVSLVVPARKAIFELRGGEPSVMHSFRDYPMDAGWGDFDGNAVPDLVVVSVSTVTASAGDDLGAAIWFQRGQAGGGLGKPQRIATQPYPATGGIRPPLLVVGEFSGDGNLDFATYNGASGTLRVYVGKGDGSFEAMTPLENVSATALAAGDYDGDGIEDIVSGVQTTVMLHYGGRGGRIRESRKYETCTPMSMTSLWSGEFTGDKRRDVIALCNNHVTLLAGEAIGLAASRRTYGFESLQLRYAPAMDTGDFDGDGKQDFVAAWPINSSWGGGSILLTMNVGLFGVLERMRLAPGPAAVVACHWDTDGRPDVLVASSQEGFVQILLDRERGSR